MNSLRSVVVSRLAVVRHRQAAHLLGEDALPTYKGGAAKSYRKVKVLHDPGPRRFDAVSVGSLHLI